MAQRKKKVAGIEQSEKYLQNREAKLDLHEEFINQPLNEDVEGKNVFAVTHCRLDFFSMRSRNDELFPKNYRLLLLTSHC